MVATTWGLSRWWNRLSLPGGETRDSAHPDSAVVELQALEAQALFGFVRRLGLSDADADEAVQEVLVRLLDALRNGTAVDNPRAWAYRSIYRLAMDEHRLRRRVIGLMGRLRQQPASNAPEIADRIAVWTEVDRLPERQRQVLYLRYRSDLAYEDIGHALGITAGAARSHATQAMATLRTRLAAEIEEF
ncbi:MAG: sigma-70 family RNA polymerase sigma factor [Chloroflexi bacterium]|nr:sigma-70 family RNA polymerase sigma factor [Chloroflexota bacterium]